MAKTKKRADGRYCRRIYLGIVDGKKKYKSFYGATDKEAKAKEDAYRRALGQGMDAEQHGATVQQVFDNYLATQQSKGVGAGWLGTVRSHIRPLAPLMPYPASSVKSAALQDILNSLADWHHGKPPLAHKTLLHFLGTWRHAFDLAMPEIIQYNPCAKVVVPAGTPAKVRLPIEEYQQTWVQKTKHRAQRAAMLMLYSGLRRGEATALTWEDVDLRAGTISVSKSYDFKGKRVKAAKTAAGTRIVNIPRVLADYLAVEKQSEASLCQYVLHNQRGNMMSEQAWKRLWQSYMVDLNAAYGYDTPQDKHAVREKVDGVERGALAMAIKTFTPHQLRHTFCTLLYLAGVDVMTARDQMGHADIKTTMQIYTHLDKKYKRHSMSKLDDFLITQQT